MARDTFVVGLARGHPPGHVVLRKAEFGQLVHDDELAQCGLLGEFAAESDAVVEQAEHRVEAASGRFAFAYRDAQLVVAVADEVLLRPRPGSQVWSNDVRAVASIVSPSRSAGASRSSNPSVEKSRRSVSPRLSVYPMRPSRSATRSVSPPSAN